MSRVTAIISALANGIIVCLSRAVNHYRDNAITYKAQRQKCQRTEAGERGTTDTCRCVSVMLLRSMQIHEGKQYKPKMMPATMLPLVVVGCTSKQSGRQ